MPTKRARIIAVRPDSIAAELGINPGDEVVAINGEPVPDLIAYRYLCADENLQVEIKKADGETWLLDIEKDYGEDLGLEFSGPTFDGLRHCANKCLFCFVDQMPAGLRPGLYIKDDDYRYSFLHGNFITLTNLKPGDWDYILRWHLSPLYISVHTTNPELRRHILGNPRAGAIMDQLGRLAAGGIQMHTQIVLCPGLNDGPELERTVKDLSRLFPAVQSIAVVPVGLTAEREGLFPLRRVTPGEAREIVTRIEEWQSGFRQSFGRGLVYGADELYLLAGIPLPAAAYYDDFPQTENGIGITRLFLDEYEVAVKKIPRAMTGQRRVVVATGVLIAPLLTRLVQRLVAGVTNLEARVVAVPNRFFGPKVTVAGLLTGQDLLAELGEAASWAREKKGLVILPDVMLKSDAPVFLDDRTPAMLARELGVRVEIIPATGEGLVAGILEV
ncbi:Fe-S oxidoreductase, related to NifB/MoaA family [Moorella thermoacetica Y72]|uniref:Fe-S oxidoreductase, related to NifB/MoaA family n=1 Tax=Moorella thermoacetica Y72 TaxID=1325331 RepID=A0A0S6UDP5_NEOTH|nr:DUF512 domain-containing protein [Moorella thermoacetica]GAF27106.1 Fe-S oxidoreductase, related to NifB/MoaA family [Moorella thermoacetica Y72]